MQANQHAPLLYRGSVKDVHGPLADGSLIFVFSDRYSIFDWGEMPDAIPEKGKALAATTYAMFRYLSSKGIDHHCLGLLDENAQLMKTLRPSRAIKVKAVEIIKPLRHAGAWNYQAYQQRPLGCLVPLEVIFRFGVPTGSSLLKRLQSNPAYAQELQISADIKEGSTFANPVIEFSTKLEESDHFLSREEAARLAGLNQDELALLRRESLRIARYIQEFYAAQDIELWDGKLEFAFRAGSPNCRGFMLVDAIGPDELRLVYKGIPLSKELIRQIYLPNPWYQEIKKAQELAKSRGSTQWRQICKEELCSLPPALSDRQLQIASGVYQNIADFSLQACGEKAWFPGKMCLDEISSSFSQGAEKASR